MRRGNRSAVSVCPVRAVTFESFDLKVPVWYAAESSDYLGHVCICEDRR